MRQLDVAAGIRRRPRRSRMAEGLARLPVNTAAFLQLVATLALGFGVGARYVGHLSLSFVNELALVFACWIAFLGAAEGIRNHYHVTIDLVTSRLPMRAQPVTELIVCAVLTLSLGTLAYLGYVYLLGSTSRLQAMDISRRPLIASMPVGFTFMTYYMARNAIAAARGIFAETYSPPAYTPESILEDSDEDDAIARLYGDKDGTTP